jgi:hypothetical protein
VQTGDRARARERLARTVAALQKLDAEGRLPATSRPLLASLRADLAGLDAR